MICVSGQNIDIDQLASNAAVGGGKMKWMISSCIAKVSCD
jgi:hypothetical protein